jgi:hypothetical protein
VTFRCDRAPDARLERRCARPDKTSLVRAASASASVAGCEHLLQVRTNFVRVRAAHLHDHVTRPHIGRARTDPFAVLDRIRTGASRKRRIEACVHLGFVRGVARERRDRFGGHLRRADATFRVDSDLTAAGMSFGLGAHLLSGSDTQLIQKRAGLLVQANALRDARRRRTRPLGHDLPETGLAVRHVVGDGRPDCCR